MSTERDEDRALLEKAAKAAGIRVTWEPTHHCFWVNPGQGLPVEPWNPLVNDATALRLAVKLIIDISPPRTEDDDAKARRFDARNGIYVAQAADPFAATRLAITRAAASLAPDLPGEGG